MRERSACVLRLCCIGDNGKQICDPNIHAGLRKQRCGLASMMRLMVEEVHDEAEEHPVCGHAFGVRIVQNLIQVVVRNRARPFRNHLIERPSIACEALNVWKEQLIKACRGREISYQFKRRVVGGMGCEAF